LVPMLAARLLGDASPAAGQRRSESRLSKLSAALGRQLDRLETAYERLLKAGLAAPWAIGLGSLVLLGSSATMGSRIGMELMPESDEGRLDVGVELPVGTPLETMSGVMKTVERRARAAMLPGELEHVVTSAGPEAWWRPGGSHEGKLDITLVPVGARERGIDAIEGAIRQALDSIPGAKIQIRKSSANILTRIVRGGDDRLAVEIRGHDLETANQLAQEVVAIMTATDGITYARPDRELGQLERVLHVDRERAAELGLGSADVAAAVEHYVLGRVATRYRDQGDEF